MPGLLYSQRGNDAHYANAMYMFHADLIKWKYSTTYASHLLAKTP